MSCIYVLDVMYLCVKGIDFASFYDFFYCIFETVPKVVLFVFHLLYI
jgi:hypothetical protein